MIVYRMFEDGGFVAGDTATERTSYAYPTSTGAIDAKRNPAKVAAEMVDGLLPLEGRFRITADHDARNWRLLNETRFANKRGVTMEHDIAGYAAEYSSCTGMLCYGYGATKDAAWREVRSQIIGATGSMQRMILPRIKLRALSADEASEICEMLATPW
jgi:hypothetical protein